MIFPFFYETKADHTMSLWNVFAMLAARFFLRLCSILCFLDFPALWLGRFDYHPSQNKDHQIPDDHMGVLRHDSSIPTRFFAVTLKVVFKRNEGETNSNLNLPISRTTRHGTTVLALPSRGFWMNLTLHMDIEAPWPGGRRSATRRESSLGCVLVYRYTKEGNINELRHNSMYGYENNRNSLVYRYTRTAPFTGTVFKLLRHHNNSLFKESITQSQIEVFHLSRPITSA